MKVLYISPLRLESDSHRVLILFRSLESEDSLLRDVEKEFVSMLCLLDHVLRDRSHDLDDPG